MVVVIVVAVVAFLALDAFILYRVFIRSRRDAGVYGALPVPGETEVVVQPGKVRVTYQESKSSTVQVNETYFEVPAALSVGVLTPSGKEVTLKGPGFKGKGRTTVTGFGKSQALIGTFEAGETGAYTVRADGELPGAVEPQVLIGR